MMDILIYNTLILNTAREEKMLKADMTIIENGQSPDKILFIKSGKIALAANKRVKAFTNKENNSFIGIKELVLETKYQFTARTVEPTVIIEIDSNEFFNKMKSNPELRLQVMTHLGKDITKYENR